jgi:hypothetical protein
MGIHRSKHKLITFLNIETFQTKILSSAYKLLMSFLLFLHRTLAFTDVQTEEIFIDVAQHTKSPTLNATQSSCTADHKQHHNLQTNKHLQKQKHTTPPSTSTARSLSY